MFYLTLDIRRKRIC